MEILNSINELLTGFRVINTSSKDIPICLARGLTGAEKLQRKIHYNRSYNEALSIGIPKEEDVLRQLNTRGTWGGKQERQIFELQKYIDEQTRTLPYLKYKIGRKKSTLRNIEKAKEGLLDLKARKSNLVSSCAERWAEEQSLYWMIPHILFRPNGTPVWNSLQDFYNTDAEKVNSFTIDYLNNFTMSEKDIRAIARHPEWRVYYKSCGNSKDLFNRPTCDFDRNQISVIHWSAIYDSAMGAYDPPSDTVIDNDTEFDAWLKAQNEKYKKEMAKRRIDGGSSIGGNQLKETFVFTDQEGARLLQEETGCDQHPQVAKRV